MSPTTALPAGPGGAPRAAGQPAPQAVQAVPFIAAAHEHTEPAFTSVVTPGANSVTLGPFDVPAFGYMRHILLEVSGTGGVLGTGVLTADWPWNIFEAVTLYDVNGAPIYGPFDGYAMLWSNIVGGYAFEQDPRGDPLFSGGVNPVFYLRIPVEISHGDGMGSLSNQNAAASYKVELRVRPLVQLISPAPTTAPSLTIRGWLEAWTLPNEVDLAGRPQAQLPPAHGTTQYWSHFTRSVIAGANTIQLPRVGNLIRNLIIIARSNAGARDDTAFYDTITFQWDARVLYQESRSLRIRNMWERLVDTGRDAGVFVYSFSHSDMGRSGDGSPVLWLPTVQSSRLELQGNASIAGSLQILTNDIAPAEVIPAERFVETSRSGFTPERGIGPSYRQA